MSEWKLYRRKGFTEMRPYIPGEDLTGVRISRGDLPQAGGMIACNPADSTDQWYVNEAYFEANMELVE